MITPYQWREKGPSFPMIGLMLMVTLLDLFHFDVLSQKNKQSGPATPSTSQRPSYPLSVA